MKFKLSTDKLIKDYKKLLEDGTLVKRFKTLKEPGIHKELIGLKVKTDTIKELFWNQLKEIYNKAV